MDPSPHPHHHVHIPQHQPHYPPSLPPGFRFHPTDEELVTHYLSKKAAADPLPLHIITDIDLYKFDPWELPGMACFGENEWYFFSLRDRKYPNGARPNRASASGYWKATGTDKPITGRGGTRKVGVKKALVFYKGKPPKGIKTHWIMHEYRLTTDLGSSSRPSIPSFSSTRKSLRLDDWVLCRIYKKNRSAAGKDEETSLPKLGESKEEESSSCIDQACVSLPQDQRLGAFPKMNSFDSFLDVDPFLENFLLDPEPSNYGMMHPHHHHQLININGGKFLGQQDIMIPQGIVPKAELAESKDTIRSFMDHWPTNLNQKYTQPPLWQGEVKAMSRANS